VYPSSSSPLGWEADEQGTGSLEGNQQSVPNPMKINFIVSHMTESSLINVTVFMWTLCAELRITQICMRKHTQCCSLQTSTTNPYSRGTDPEQHSFFLFSFDICHYFFWSISRGTVIFFGWHTFPKVVPNHNQLTNQPKQQKIATYGIFGLK